MKVAYSSIIKLTREFASNGFCISGTMTPMFKTIGSQIDNSRSDFDCAKFTGCIKETLYDEYQVEDTKTLKQYCKRIVDAILANKPQIVKHQDRFDGISIF